MVLQVQKVVRAQPGLLSVETLSDTSDHHKYVVLSEVCDCVLSNNCCGAGSNHVLVCVRQWRSKKDYDSWLASEDFKECTAKINEVLDVPGKRTTIFKRPQEDIFLL